MSLEAMIEFVTTPLYRRIAFLLFAFCIAVALSLFAFVLYQSRKGVPEETEISSQSNLLLATFADSLLITVLFTAESMVYLAGDLAKDSAVDANSFSLLVPFFAVFLKLVFELLIAWIAVTRVMKLFRWLRQNTAN